MIMINTFNTTIRDFLAPKKLAIAGVSRNPSYPSVSGLPAGVSHVVGTCILLHVGPVSGIHSFHRGFLKLFGMLPK
jgi:hypothetical protein